MTHTDLKPCPLCQGADLIRGHRTMDDGSHNPVVLCHGCGCRAPLSAWNTRARTPDTAPSQSADLIRQVERYWAAADGDDGAYEADMMRSLVTALREADEAEETLASENARWKRRVEIQRDLIIRHEQTIERFLEALMFIKSGDCADPENTARRALGGSNET